MKKMKFSALATIMPMVLFPSVSFSADINLDDFLPWQETLTYQSKPNASVRAVVDLDQDGLKDLFVVHRGIGGQARVMFAKPRESHNARIENVISGPFEGTPDIDVFMQPKFGDFNRDGKIDMLLVDGRFGRNNTGICFGFTELSERAVRCGNFKANIEVRSSLSGSTTTKNMASLPDLTNVEVVDINNDGYDDIVYSLFTEGVHIFYGYHDAEQKGFVHDVVKSEQQLQGTMVNVGDYNGDGYADVLTQYYIRYGRQVDLAIGSSLRKSRESYKRIHLDKNSNGVAGNDEAYTLPGTYSFINKGRFNNDDIDDLLIVQAKVDGIGEDHKYLLTGKSPIVADGVVYDHSGLLIPIPYTFDKTNVALKPADLNNDGLTDLIYRDEDGKNARIYFTQFEDQKTVFKPATLPPIRSNGQIKTDFEKRLTDFHRHGLIVDDFNGDGWNDLIRMDDSNYLQLLNPGYDPLIFNQIGDVAAQADNFKGVTHKGLPIIFYSDGTTLQYFLKSQTIGWTSPRSVDFKLDANSNRCHQDLPAGNSYLTRADLSSGLLINPVSRSFGSYDFNVSGKSFENKVPQALCNADFSDHKFDVYADNKYVYIFRLDGNNHRVLADRFILQVSSNTLVKSIESRFRLSEQRFVKSNPQDVLGTKDVSGNNFYEPTFSLPYPQAQTADGSKQLLAQSAYDIAVTQVPTGYQQDKRWFIALRPSDSSMERQVFALNVLTNEQDIFAITTPIIDNSDAASPKRFEAIEFYVSNHHQSKTDTSFEAITLPVSAKAMLHGKSTDLANSQMVLMTLGQFTTPMLVAKGGRVEDKVIGGQTDIFAYGEQSSPSTISVVKSIDGTATLLSSESNTSRVFSTVIASQMNTFNFNGTQWAMPTSYFPNAIAQIKAGEMTNFKKVHQQLNHHNPAFRRTVFEEAPFTAYLTAETAKPLVLEYVDLVKEDGSTKGVIKRLTMRQFTAPKTGSKKLYMSNSIVGSSTATLIGRVSISDELIGYIEGAPPIPKENLVPLTPRLGLNDATYGGDDAKTTLTRSRGTTVSYSQDTTQGGGISASGYFGPGGDEGKFRVGASIDYRRGNLSGGQVSATLQTEETMTTELSGTAPVHRCTANETPFLNDCFYEYATNEVCAQNGASNYDQCLPACPSQGPATQACINLVRYPSGIEKVQMWDPSNRGLAVITSTSGDMYNLYHSITGQWLGTSIDPTSIRTVTKNRGFIISDKYAKLGSLDGRIGSEQVPGLLAFGGGKSYIHPQEEQHWIDTSERQKQEFEARYKQEATGLSDFNQVPVFDQLVRSKVNVSTEGCTVIESSTLNAQTDYLGFSDSVDVSFGVMWEFTAVGEGSLLGNGFYANQFTRSKETGEGLSLVSEIDCGLLTTAVNSDNSIAAGLVDSYNVSTYYLPASEDNFHHFFDAVLSEDEQLLNFSTTPKKVWRIVHRVEDGSVSRGFSLDQ